MIDVFVSKEVVVWCVVNAIAAAGCALTGPRAQLPKIEACGDRSAKRAAYIHNKRHWQTEDTVHSGRGQTKKTARRGTAGVQHVQADEETGLANNTHTHIHTHIHTHTHTHTHKRVTLKMVLGKQVLLRHSCYTERRGR